jgi:hypothetical protein
LPPNNSGEPLIGQRQVGWLAADMVGYSRFSGPSFSEVHIFSLANIFRVYLIQLGKPYIASTVDIL